MVSSIFYIFSCSPLLRGNDPIWRIISFKWVSSTTRLTQTDCYPQVPTIQAASKSLQIFFLPVRGLMQKPSRKQRGAKVRFPCILGWICFWFLQGSLIIIKIRVPIFTEMFGDMTLGMCRKQVPLIQYHDLGMAVIRSKSGDTKSTIDCPVGLLPRNLT